MSAASLAAATPVEEPPPGVAAAFVQETSETIYDCWIKRLKGLPCDDGAEVSS